MPASEVDELSYGDCKALTNYTKVLLDAAGVPSYYTIVYAGNSKRDLDEDFASIQGNHVILGIPDDGRITWLECTSQFLPFGYIGSFTEDRNVLAVTPEGGKLMRTKTYSSLENSQKTEATIKLDENAKIVAEFKSVSRGLQYEDKYFLTWEKDSDIDMFYKKRWNYINGLTLNDIEFDNDKEEIVFTEKLQLEASKYVTQVGTDYLLAPNIFNPLSLNLPTMEDRKQNLNISWGYLDEDRYVYELPSSLKIENLPEATLIENQFGHYEVRFTQLTDHSFEYYRKFLLNKGEYAPEEYEAYRQFMKSLSQLDRTKILISKKQ